MKQNLVLTFDSLSTIDANKLKELIDLDLKNYDSPRSKTKIFINDKELKIEINAKDATAMRASINSVLKTSIIFEKTKEVIENGRK